MKVSALILTLNEAENIERCLRSLTWCEKIVVLDSHSSDDTAERARALGAEVHYRTFDNYAAQRNHGINQIAYQTDWVLMVDADEEVSEELRREIGALEMASECSLYRMRRKDFFCGKWMRFSSGYPTWFGRLVKRGDVRVEREINEEYVTKGRVGLLQAHLHHYPFNKGFHSWLEKHNRYSSMEATMLWANGDRLPIQWRGLFSNDPPERRRVVKLVVYRMPARPLIVFGIFYFFKLGFLDGGAGLRFALLKTIYEYQISCKVLELSRRDKHLPI